jgi:hypothetical protein
MGFCSGEGLVGAGVGALVGGDMLGAGVGDEEGGLPKGVTSDSSEGSLIPLLHAPSSKQAAILPREEWWCEVMSELVYRRKAAR